MRRATKSPSRRGVPTIKRVATGQRAIVVFDGIPIPITGPVFADAVGTAYVEGRTPGGQLVRVAITAPEETEGA
jgi:hypothetical protein